ncbi:MAG: thiol reductant ABC exporter subunit CydC [Gammaproteobacteria bacterium RIFCSPHIGHO2_12_FULL_40_19]|nr:MAG: thiol reductant ABC exporter subunit CydC [Gammaproteobacteria bacterium RIFCSPHIGHO2_12_FULL_40_19]
MSSLWFFIKKLSTYRLQLCVSLALSLALAVSSIALLTLSGWFISAAAFAGLAATTAIAFNYFIPAAVIRLLAFIRILSRYQDRVTSHDFTLKILSTLRVWFYQQLIPLTPAHLLTHRSGDLLNRFVNDVNTLDHLYLNVLSPFFMTIILSAGITLFIGYFSLPLALITLLLLLTALISIPLITLKKGKKIGKAIQEATKALRIKTVDCLQGFLDILLFVNDKNRVALLNDEHVTLMRAQKRLAQLKGFAIGAMQFFSGITLWLIFFIGIPLVHNNLISGAALAMIIFLVMATFEHCVSVPLASLLLGKTEHAANRLLRVANQTPAVIFSDTPILLKSMTDTQISFKDVSFSYLHRSISILNHIHLDIPAGMHLGITGPSGSGKTTLMQLLARIFDPTQGEILMGNIPLKNFSEIDLRKTISLVTQHVHIFNASVRDNLTLMQAHITDDSLLSVLKKVELLELIEALPEQLNTLMGEFGKNFSGGQIRRISIARALLHNAPIMIFDEPSTGLEDHLMARIWKNCEMDFKDKTIIVITHDENLLAKMDRVYSM